jgi:hypothetical protein
MTFHTVMAKLASHMIGIRCAVECSSMTIPTRHGKILILIVDVTAIACDRLVRTCQRELRRTVVKRRGQPGRGCVTWAAIVVEVAKDMVGVRRLSKPSLVALVAVDEDQLVVAVDVASLTLKRHMRSGKWERSCVMIE